MPFILQISNWGDWSNGSFTTDYDKSKFEELSNTKTDEELVINYGHLYSGSCELEVIRCQSGYIETLHDLEI